MPSTRIRSASITGSFLAYGLGCVFINLVAMYMNSAVELMFSSLILIMIATTPTYFNVQETPKYLLKKGQISDLVNGIYALARFN